MKGLKSLNLNVTRNGLNGTGKSGMPLPNALDEPEADVIEPEKESSTKINEAAWQEKGRQSDLHEPDQTTRQEDTELGIFRPDEL